MTCNNCNPPINYDHRYVRIALLDRTILLGDISGWIQADLTVEQESKKIPPQGLIITKNNVKIETGIPFKVLNNVLGEEVNSAYNNAPWPQIDLRPTQKKYLDKYKD